MLEWRPQGPCKYLALALPALCWLLAYQQVTRFIWVMCYPSAVMQYHCMHTQVFDSCPRMWLCCLPLPVQTGDLIGNLVTSAAEVPGLVFSLFMIHLCSRKLAFAVPMGAIPIVLIPVLAGKGTGAAKTTTIPLVVAPPQPRLRPCLLAVATVFLFAVASTTRLLLACLAEVP